MVKIESQENKEQFLGFTIRAKPNRSQPIQNIKVLVDENKKICPRCKKKLIDYANKIPLTDVCYILVKGLFCSNCNCFYVDSGRGKKIRQIFYVNTHTKLFTFNSKSLYSNPPYQRSDSKKIYAILSQVVKEEQLYLKCREEVYRAKKDQLPVYPYYVLHEWTMEEYRKKRDIIDSHREDNKINNRRIINKPLEAFHKEIEAIPSAVLGIIIDYSGKKHKYIIINNKVYEDCEKNIIHYSREIAREILTAACYSKRKGIGYLNKEKFKVIQIVSVSKYRNVPENLVPRWLVLEPSGGYQSSIVNKNYELVDVLLYSPFTKRFEMLKATYNKIEDYCFVSKGKFRLFLDEYGKPDVNVTVDSPSFASDGWNDLKMESFLHAYGYNASENGPSERTRHEILAEIVDLEYMKPEEIVRFLSNLIKLHPQNSFFNAREKWNADRKYIADYKVNPERFIIAK